MISTVRPVNIRIQHPTELQLFPVMRNFKIYFLSNFKIFSAVLLKFSNKISSV